MRTEIELDMRTYVQDLERYLQLALFDREFADPGGAVLLVRGARAGGHPARAAGLADATQRLAAVHPGDADLAIAALHARALVEQDPAALEDVAGRYPAAMARAAALEDAGLAWAQRGDEENAAERLRAAYAVYEQLGAGHRMARVRSCLRAVGTRVRHWKNADRPAYGWDSLTDTERRIVDLVAQGLSNREVAGQVFLSAHTVAFHLRHVFWKLGLTSRVQLARLAAEQSTGQSTGQSVPAAGRHPQPA